MYHHPLSPFTPIEQPRELHETVTRALSPQYARIVEAQRPLGLHFDSRQEEAIRELLTIIAPLVAQGIPEAVQARDHWNEALNGAISEQARTEHFDIGGAKIFRLTPMAAPWSTIPVPSDTVMQTAERALVYWQAWGGC